MESDHLVAVRTAQGTDAKSDHFVWASDYPRIDASFGVVGETRSRLAPLPEDAQAKVLGLNAVRFYGLEVPALV